MKASLLSLLVVVVLACGACTDAPTAPTTFTGTNGFVINGGKYSNLQVNAEKASVEYLDEFGHQLGIRLSLAKLDSTNIDVSIAIPNNVGGPATFSWVREEDFAPNDGYFNILYGGEENFTSDSVGQTTITAFPAIGGDVTGTFSGKVFSPDKKTTYNVQGKFTAHRVD
ncbi:MAG: hypothetical protein ABIQ57_16595 [Candidatus Kapaibacterium sp.]